VKPALVILAAGASTRLGECKALVSITPKNPLELLTAAGFRFDEAPPLVVTGADHAAISARVPSRVEVVFNPAWAAGRAGGLALAHACRPGRDLVVAPVDVPLVPFAVFEALRVAWSDAGSPALGWLAPSARLDVEKKSGSLRFGHPIVIGRELVSRLQHAAPDVPLRELRAEARPLWSIEVRCKEVLDDLDTPLDLARLRARSRV
jgi:CTP:molybdopterin cytidylyltransferase MocA